MSPLQTVEVNFIHQTVSWSDMSHNAKQQTLWFMKSNVTNGANFLSSVCVCVCLCVRAHARTCMRAHERVCVCIHLQIWRWRCDWKHARLLQAVMEFLVRVCWAQAIKSEAIASFNRSITVTFNYPYSQPQNHRLKCYLTEHGPIQNKLPEYSEKHHLVASIW